MERVRPYETIPHSCCPPLAPSQPIDVVLKSDWIFVTGCPLKPPLKRSGQKQPEMITVYELTLNA